VSRISAAMRRSHPKYKPPDGEAVWQAWRRDVDQAKAADDAELAAALAKLEPQRPPRTAEQRAADASAEVNAAIRKSAGRVGA
jgi:hypothetical protein